jgi:hypothetical protein
MPWTGDPFEAERDDYASSVEGDEQWGEVHIDGIPIPIQDQLGVVNLATMPQRLTFGDYTLASDNILSVWVQSDWTGGGQVEDLREASHAQRFRAGTADSRYPRILSQGIETTSYTITNATNAIPIGDYAVTGTTYFWVAFDDGTKRLRKWNKTGLYDGGADLSAMPTNKGVVFDGLLWIPQGSSGYDTWDGVTVTHGADATITPIAFVEWDDKLVALEHDGQVSQYIGGSWVVDPLLKLHGDRVPRGLVVWWTADRFPAVYVVTNRDVWAVDFLVPVLYLTGLHFPVHPDQGLGSCAWRDDAMYVSVGMGVHQLALGMNISAMGLDRDDGMPPEFRGRIVDMEPEYNSMYALVEGTSFSIVSTIDPDVAEETMIYDAEPIFPDVTTFARSTLMRWTGLGWHTAWESPGSAGVPTRVMVSQADGQYFVAWGYAGSMYHQQLRRTFHNPRQGADAKIDRFSLASYISTGRFDANLSTFTKLASHLEVMVDDSSLGDITVSYQTDRSGGFSVLGLIPSGNTGRQIIGFDTDGEGFAEGVPFRWIELRYDFVGYDPTTTTIVNWASLYFVVRPLQSSSFRGITKLGIGDEQQHGEGNREIADFLDGLTTSEYFSVFKHRDRAYRVLVVQTQGADRTGKDLRGDRTFSVIRVDVPRTGS